MKTLTHLFGEKSEVHIYHEYGDIYSLWCGGDYPFFTGTLKEIVDASNHFWKWANELNEKIQRVF